MPYSHKIQNELQEKLGPMLRQLYVMLVRARNLDELTIQKNISPDKASIDKMVFAEVAKLLNLKITLTETTGFKGFFRPKWGGAIRKDPETNLVTIPKGVVFFHEIIKNSGHYHLGRPYPTTLGGGRCGFAALAQLFEHWKDNESIPGSALTGIEKNNEASINRIENKFKEIIAVGKSIIQNHPLMVQPSEDQKGRVNVGCGFGG